MIQTTHGLLHTMAIANAYETNASKEMLNIGKWSLLNEHNVGQDMLSSLSTRAFAQRTRIQNTIPSNFIHRTQRPSSIFASLFPACFVFLPNGLSVGCGTAPEGLSDNFEVYFVKNTDRQTWLSQDCYIHSLRVSEPIDVFHV